MIMRKDVFLELNMDNHLQHRRGRWYLKAVALRIPLVKVRDYGLTELSRWDRSLEQHHFSDEEVEMTEDDERRWGSWAAIVLFDQLVSLKLPDTIRVVMDLLKCVAVQAKD